MTITELINELQEIQKNILIYIYLKKNRLIKEPFRRKDKYFIRFSEERTREEKDAAYEYYRNHYA